MIRLSENEDFAKAHCNLVETSLKVFINYVLTKKGLPAAEVRTVKVLENDLKEYLEDLLAGTKLAELIKTLPKDLPTVIMKFNNKVKSYNNAKKDTAYLLDYIFIGRAYKELDKWAFVDRLSIDTCIYCNRNYIYHLKRKQKVKPQLDHFYPKHIYPYLGISYYNLIPTCQTCNGFDCKGKEDPSKLGTLLTNPYLITDGDFQFTYQIKDAHYLNSLNNHNSLDIVFKKKIGDHLSVFKLDGLYSKHTDHVAELIFKSKLKYTETYRDHLISQYQSLGLTDNEIDRMILGNYSTDANVNKRPLSKLYSDIGKELGLIFRKK